MMQLTFVCWSVLMLMTNERKSEQAHIPHAPTLLENAVYNEWQFQALGMGNRTKMGISIAPQKDQISISCKNAYLPVHIMSFITSKFHAILLSVFSGVVLTNCFSNIFLFREISKFKKGYCSQKKNWIKMSCGYAQNIWLFNTLYNHFAR